jgi:hypothetical protein
VAQSFTPWQHSDQYPAGTAPFRVAETFGPAPKGHDYLDNLRMFWRRTPEATYPDGYLGTINTRRGDRLMNNLKARQQNRPNSRGIHKGERIDAKDYIWPDEFNQWSGIVAEVHGSRFVSPGMEGGMLAGERYPTDHKGVGPRSVPVGNRYVWTGGGPRPAANPDRTPVLQSQAPPWASGVRGNPGMAVPYPGR